jgi:hypothetical protein
MLCGSKAAVVLVTRTPTAKEIVIMSNIKQCNYALFERGEPNAGRQLGYVQFSIESGCAAHVWVDRLGVIDFWVDRKVRQYYSLVPMSTYVPPVANV